MKIAIIGAGAMGGLFGAYLARSGAEVSVVDIRPELIAAIQANGLTVEEPEGEMNLRLQAVVEAEQLEPVDLVIVFVKSAETLQAAKSAGRILREGGRILTLQNGMGNAEVIAAVVGSARVLAGTTAHGATLLEPGRIRHAGRGETQLGRLDGSADDFCREVAALFSSAGLPTRVDDDVKSLIWGKLVINAGINALTALLKCPNGQLAERDETRELVALAVREAVAVAEAAGIRLPYADAVDKVLSVAFATAANQSSMLQDLLRGRPTEVAVINGAVVREGVRLGVATPVNRILELLIRSLENC
jgi:2-dehydropantoate 2-reductase